MSAASSPPPSPASAAPPPANGWIAERLRQAATLLLAQGANPFRANAYHRAAEMLGRQPRDVRAIAAEGGYAALDALPGVGPSLAGAISEMLATGRWSFLERLKNVRCQVFHADMQRGKRSYGVIG